MRSARVKLTNKKCRVKSNLEVIIWALMSPCLTVLNTASCCFNRMKIRGMTVNKKMMPSLPRKLLKNSWRISIIVKRNTWRYNSRVCLIMSKLKMIWYIPRSMNRLKMKIRRDWRVRLLINLTRSWCKCLWK